MTCAEKLELLRSRLTPLHGECECGGLSQQELMGLLDQCGGDVDKASYYACMRLAECSAVSTPEIETESSRDYWISLARLYRPSRTGTIARSDEGGMA